MKIRQKILTIISIFVLLYATYYWVVPFLVNIKSRIPLIQEFAKKEFGAQVELKEPNLKMGLTPSVWLEAESFSVLDKKSTPFSIENPKLKIDLIPLVFGKIHLAYFSCDKVNANLKIDKKYRLYIGDYLITKKENPNFSIENAKMDIGTYQVALKDEFQNKNIKIDGNYFYLEKFNSKSRLKFTTNSKLRVDNHESTINMDVDFKLPFKKGFDTNEILFDGSVSNLHLDDFSPYIVKFSKGKIQRTGGVLNIQADTKSNNFKSKNFLTSRITSHIVVDNFLIMGKDKASTMYFKNKLNLKSVCDFSKNKLAIKQFEIVSGDLNLNLGGKINKISSRKPFYDLSVEVKNSKAEDFISLMPAITIPDFGINLAALKKYVIYGDVNGKLFVKGKNPNITGSLVLKNGYVIKQLPSNIEKAKVKVVFLGDKFSLNVLFPVCVNNKVLVSGMFEMFNEKKADIDVTSTSQIDLQTVESILNPLHEIFNFPLGPLPIMKVKGIGSVKLKISGPQLRPSVFGSVNFINTYASFKDIATEVQKANAVLTFNDQDAHFISHEAYVNGKNVSIDGRASSSGNLDFDVTANGQELKDLLYILKYSPKLSSFSSPIPQFEHVLGKANLKLKLKGNVKNIDDFILGKNVIASGNVKLLGNSVSISLLNIPIKNIFGNIKFKNTDADFDLYSVVDKSRIYLKGKARNNILKTKVKLDDLAFSCLGVPVKVYSGILEINSDRLSLYKVNVLFDSMPILIDGTISDIFKNPNVNIYINSKPTQKFIDKYVNRNATYPLKIRGDINYASRIHGNSSLFNVKTEVKMQEDSNIYYMGANIGDVNNPIKLYLDANISKSNPRLSNLSSIYINNFQYDKLISSQNNKEFVSPQMTAKGQIFVANNNISFRNFRLKTQNPTDAKLFNLLFKKSLIKQGLFSSNIVINNSMLAPKMLGFLNFTGVDIPLLDTTIKDVSLDFKDKDIDIKSDGEIFSNKIIFAASMANKLTKPYVFKDMDIYFGKLDVNRVFASLNKLNLESNINKYGDAKNDKSYGLTDLIIKNGKIKADNVWVKNIYASDFTTKFSLSDKLVFDLDNFNFDAAQGHMRGDFKYNLLNSNSALQLKVSNVNANTAANALFDLHNQVYGSLTGQVDLVCNGKNHKTCMNTLSGNGGFSISDGRMPKLGSLEYLLKASNLVKSGVTGLTINSIVDLITPLKTGQFENINGMFSINSGVAHEIQIFSKGKDLSLFLTGTYNFSTVVADMQVFGRLSKKISNILGPIGNTSLNTLFNTIPGLNLDASNKAEFIKNFNKIPGFELNDKTFRIFSVKIYGDINGENYVQSFKWIE